MVDPVKNASPPAIVVIDDEPFSRRLLLDTLAARHIPATDGGGVEHARDAVHSHNCSMLVINGTSNPSQTAEALHAIRADRRTASLPVLLLVPRHDDTDGSQDGSLDHAVAVADRCVPKPFSPVELLEAVECLLARGANVSAIRGIPE